MMKLTKKQKQDMEDIADRFGLSLVLLFGSQATGRITPLSDIDIAVLPKKNRRSFTLHDQLKLMVAFSELFDRDDVDVVLLTQAGPLLRYEAMTKGKVLLNRDTELRATEHMRTLRDYEDTQHFRTTHFMAMKKHLDAGTFGKISV